MDTVDEDSNEARRSKPAGITVSLINVFVKDTLLVCLFQRSNEHLESPGTDRAHDKAGHRRQSCRSR